MLKERISDDIYVFTSDLYAQVTAGAVIYQDGAVLIDTLAFPSETLEIKDYIEHKLGVPVRYVINTHYHADHTNGNYLFPNARIVAHHLCREKMDTIGRRGLERAKAQSPELAQARIALPDVLINEGSMFMHLGRKTLQLFHTPGHSPDGLSVLVREERILFAGDMMMPLPHVVDGNADDLANAIQAIPELALENVVQGHGEVILRGEIDDAVKANLRYLDNLKKRVEAHLKKGKPREALPDIDVESCGKSRIPLNGLVPQLHLANLRAMYDRLLAATQPAPEPAKPPAKRARKTASPT